MSMFSCVCIIRLESDNMDNAISEVNEYLKANDYLCSLQYIVEEKE